jgi:hypothetical protein
MFDRFDWWGYAILAAVPVATFMLGVLWARREMRAGRDPAGADSFTFVGLRDGPDSGRTTLVEAEVVALSRRLASLEGVLRERRIPHAERIPTPV